MGFSLGNENLIWEKSNCTELMHILRDIKRHLLKKISPAYILWVFKMIYVSLLISIKKSIRADSIYLKASSPSIHWWQCWNGWGYIYSRFKEGYWTKNKTQTSKQELSRARHSQSYVYMFLERLILVIWLWYVYFIFIHTDFSVGGGGWGGALIRTWRWSEIFFKELEWLKDWSWNGWKFEWTHGHHNYILDNFVVRGIYQSDSILKLSKI